jgi:hypothetical protein
MKDMSMDNVQKYDIYIHVSILWPSHSSTRSMWGVVFPWLKRLKREADHSAQTISEVEDICIYTYTAPFIFIDYFLIS